MPRKPPDPKRLPVVVGADVRLAVKDGLREVRFNLRRGVRKLAQGVEAATHRGEEASSSGPLAMLGEPLGLAMRTTAAWLRTADHAAVDLLSSDGPYRAMEVPLRSSACYFAGPDLDTHLRAFTTDHYWRYRHGLMLAGRTEVFVHEQGIERAGHRCATALKEMRTALQAWPERERALCVDACVIQALVAADDVLSLPGLSPGDVDADLQDLARQLAVASVLAGEMGAPTANPPIDALAAKASPETVLRIAVEVAGAGGSEWGRALQSADPRAGLVRWMAFVLRHL